MTHKFLKLENDTTTTLYLLETNSKIIKKISINQNATNKPKIKTILNLASQLSIPTLHHSSQHTKLITILNKPTPTNLETLLSKSKILVHLQHIQDQNNLGAISRTCLGLNVDGIIFHKHNTASITSTTFKTSKGAIANIKFSYYNSTSKFIRLIKTYKFYHISTSTTGQLLTLDLLLKKLKPIINTKNIIISFGQESKGLQEKIIKHSDINLKLIQSNHIESFNLNASVAMILYCLKLIFQQ